MKVAAIYPAFDWRLNEMAMVWQRLCEQHPVDCTVFTCRHDRLKGRVSDVLHEQDGRLEVFRFDDLLSEDSIRFAVERVRKSGVDVIFCAIASNFPMALALQRVTGAPIVLHEEFLRDPHLPLPRRQYLGISWLKPAAIRRRAKKNLSMADMMLCSNPAEFSGQPSVDENVAYLPWPHPQPVFSGEPIARDRNLGVYIGSVSKAKGAENLRAYLSDLLQRDKEIRLRLIGPPTDRVGDQALHRLLENGRGRVEWIRSCSRGEALSHLAEARFVFSPGISSNWGLIGDAWSVGTPVISVSQHYDLREGFNCLVARTPGVFFETIQRIRQSDDLFNQLVNGGRSTVASHSIDSVAAVLHGCLSASLEKVKLAG